MLHLFVVIDIHIHIPEQKDTSWWLNVKLDQLLTS